MTLARARSHQAEPKIAVAQPDFVAVSQHPCRDRQAVYRSSVPASQIADFKSFRGQFADGAMPSRNRAIVDGQPVGVIAADGDLVARKREGAAFDRAADTDQARIMQVLHSTDFLA